MKKFSELEIEYKLKQEAWKLKIRQEPNKHKRFWKWVLYWLAFPWVWAWTNIRDWHTALLFVIVVVVYSGSVWGFYLAALFCGWTSTDVGKWLIGIGSGVWAWWLSPAGSPFILLCTVTTIGVKAIINKIRDHLIKRRTNK